MNGVMSRLRPEDTAQGRRPADAPTGAATISLLPIGADLLPRQAAARRAGRSTRWIAVAVVLVAILGVTAGWLLSARGNAVAGDALASAQDQQRTLQTQQKQYGELVTTQQQATQLRNTLATLMDTDTPWSTLLADVAKVRGGVTFTAVDGALTDPTAATAGGATDTTVTTPGAVGTLTISGTAADKPTVAAFVEALDGLDGLADPFLSTVTATDSGSAGYSFTVSVALTADLRTAAPSRWATTTTGGGK